NGVWTARYSLGGPRYTEDQSWPRFQAQAVAALRALPGVSAAGVTSILPFSGNNNAGSMQLEGYEVPTGAAPPHANYRSIDDGYFATLGLPIVSGRNFASHEAEPVAIIDETLAAKYWPNNSPLGRRLRADFDPADRWFTIIGVVPTVKQESLAETEAKETVYWHYEQRPQNTGVLALRTVVPPRQLSGAAA